MSTSGAPQYTPVRILSVIAAAELSVGGLGAESLADRVQRVSGASSQHAEAAASAGRSLLGALGLRALEVEPALAGSVSAVLEGHSPGATAAGARSLEERGGAAPGTSLGSLVGALRRVGAVVPVPPPAGKPAEPTPSEPMRLPDPIPSAEPAELTFDEDWTEEDEVDLLPAATVPDDLGMVDEDDADASDGAADSADDEIELEDDEEVEDDDDGPLLTDEAIDDLLADDSVDLDDDWMDDKPAS
jgi:hypothetical protein